MKYILAISDNNCIALNNDIPWHIKHDFQWFKMNTYGKTVIMGRKTWDSLRKKPLPGRRNIVVSSQLLTDVETIPIEKVKDHKDAWVIGGANLCEQLWKKNDILVITRVHTNVKDGLTIRLPNMKCIWKKLFDGYTFTINKIC